MSLSFCFQQVAPYYNLALVFVVFILFGRLFLMKKKDSFILPWKIFCGALVIYVMVQIMTVLKFAGFISYPIFVNGLLELVMVSLFIYVLLTQREHILKGRNPAKKLVKSSLTKHRRKR